ncbi:uncharacterized protein V6R79_025170 [Siganus canaliculatus]
MNRLTDRTDMEWQRQFFLCDEDCFVPMFVVDMNLWTVLQRAALADEFKLKKKTGVNNVLDIGNLFLNAYLFPNNWIQEDSMTCQLSLIVGGVQLCKHICEALNQSSAASDGAVQVNQPIQPTSSTEASVSSHLDEVEGREDEIQPMTSVQCETNPTGSDGMVIYDDESQPNISIPCEANPTGSGGAVAYENQDYPMTPGRRLASSVVVFNGSRNELEQQRDSENIPQVERASGDDSSDETVADAWL